MKFVNVQSVSSNKNYELATQKIPVKILRKTGLRLKPEMLHILLMRRFGDTVIKQLCRS